MACVNPFVLGVEWLVLRVLIAPGCTRDDDDGVGDNEVVLDGDDHEAGRASKSMTYHDALSLVERTRDPELPARRRAKACARNGSGPDDDVTRKQARARRHARKRAKVSHIRAMYQENVSADRPGATNDAWFGVVATRKLTGAGVAGAETSETAAPSTATRHPHHQRLSHGDDGNGLPSEVAASNPMRRAAREGGALSESPPSFGGLGDDDADDDGGVGSVRTMSVLDAVFERAAAMLAPSTLPEEATAPAPPPTTLRQLALIRPPPKPPSAAGSTRAAVILATSARSFKSEIVELEVREVRISPRALKSGPVKKGDCPSDGFLA